MRRSFLTFAAAVLTCTAVTLAKPVVTRADNAPTALGYGEALITLPDGWSIDRGTTYIENVAYLVKRPQSTETALRIVLSAAITQENREPSARPYCVHGLYGLTVDKDGMRTIQLAIPPPRDGSLSDNKAIFVFPRSDVEAQRIVSTFRLKGKQGTCTR